VNVAQAPGPGFTLVVSPSGLPRVVPAAGDDDVVAGDRGNAIAGAFEGGAGRGALHLGAVEVGTNLPPAFSYFRELGHELVARVCAHPDLETLRDQVRIEPPLERLEQMAGAVPPITGGEYVTADALVAVWRQAGDALSSELAGWRGPIAAWLHGKNAAWATVGRVCFHLAENKRDPDAPVVQGGAAAPAAGARARGVARRPRPGPAARSAAPGATCCRQERARSRDGAARRHLSSAALDGPRSPRLPEGGPRAGGGGSRGARAGLVERAYAAAAADQGDRGRPPAIATRYRCRARLLRAGGTRRRTSVARRAARHPAGNRRPPSVSTSSRSRARSKPDRTSTCAVPTRTVSEPLAGLAAAMRRTIRTRGWRFCGRAAPTLPRRRQLAQYTSVDALNSRPSANAFAVRPLAFHSRTRSAHFDSVPVMIDSLGPHLPVRRLVEDALHLLPRPLLRQD